MSSKNKTVFQAIDICKRFTGVQALFNVNIELHNGKILAIAGENGAGKSTLVKIFAGIIKKDSGTVTRNGILVEINNNHDATKLGIGFVHQDFGLIPQMKVVENFYLGSVFPNKCGKVQWDVACLEVTKWLDKFNLKNIDPQKRVSFLSPAQTQMLTIIKAFSRNTEILILDEPTASLTNEEKDILFNALSQMKDRGMSVVIITHKLEEIFEIADEVTVMRDGKVVSNDLIENINVNDIIKLMTGREIGAKYPPKQEFVPKNKNNIALEVKDLSSKKIKGVSFNVYKGEIFGIIGLVGSGRTEFANALCGVDRLESGKVVLFNKNLEINNVQNAVDKGICLVPEDRITQGLIMDFSVYENIVLVILQTFCHRFLRYIKKQESENIVQEFIDNFSIKTKDMNQKVKFLSGGNQQKVVLSKWLSTKVKVLVLDEVTKGIDVATKTELYKILSKLAKQGIIIIMISSEIPEVFGVCNRIGVFHNKQLNKILETKNTNEDEVLQFIFGRRNE